MNFYDYIFYRIYKSINITNKSIPHWSSVFAISSVEIVNILTLFKYFNYSVSENIFKILAISLVLLNYFIFLFNKRYLNIIKFFDDKSLKNNFFFDVLIVIYICFSILVFFYLLNLKLVYSLVLISVVVITSLLAYMKSKRG